MAEFEVSLAGATEERLSCLTRCLSDAFAGLHTTMTDTGVWEVDEAAGRLRFEYASSGAGDGKRKVDIVRVAAEGLAEYVLTESEPLLLRAIIRKQYRYEADEYLDTIIWHCRQLLYGNGTPEEIVHSAETRGRRKKKVAQELQAYLEEHASIHLDGYITFRLGAYWEELREIVEYAVDEFVMDKQYQEFISLLRYFVCLQEPKIAEVHLIHVRDGEFALFDDRHEPIEHRPVDRVVAEMLEAEMNVEDMVVSSLITLSPKQIVIHTRQKDLQVIRTIEAIFEERVELCTSCRSCLPYFERAMPSRD
jgi:putative sporulation protein YtxC